MSILIVSNNPLFKEVIIESAPRYREEFVALVPEEALDMICKLNPDVIIIDETIAPSRFENLLAEARRLIKNRIIVLNPLKNEIILLDSYRETLKKAEDLNDAICGLRDKKILDE